MTLGRILPRVDGSASRRPEQRDQVNRIGLLWISKCYPGLNHAGFRTALTDRGENIPLDFSSVWALGAADERSYPHPVGFSTRAGTPRRSPSSMAKTCATGGCTEPATTRGKMAWTGENDSAKGGGHQIRLYLSTWENPPPDEAGCQHRLCESRRYDRRPLLCSDHLRGEVMSRKGRFTVFRIVKIWT